MTEQVSNLDDIKRRIAKALAIASDERCDPNTAAVAAAQAEKLMRKYQLDHSEIISINLKKGESMTTAECVANAKTNGTKAKDVPTWASILGTSVARFNNCGALIVTTGSGEVGIRFYGYEGDVLVCKYMFDYLVVVTNRQAAHYKLSRDYMDNGRSALTIFRRGFVAGMVNTIQRLMREKEREQQAEVTSRALVVVKQTALAEKFGAHIFKTKQAANVTKQAVSFLSGFEQGRRVDVARKGIGHAPAAPVKRIGH